MNLKNQIKYLKLLFLILFCTNLLASETITILHVGDTHSSLESTLLILNIDGKKIQAKVGGYAALATAIKKTRKQKKNSLFLHSGDFFQGTLYFSKFLGKVDTKYFNLIKLDIGTLGNHEFDRGAKLLNNNLLELAHFPLVSANVNLNTEPSITRRDKFSKFKVFKVGETRIGVIGLTTIDTPSISNPGRKIQFLPLVEETQKAVNYLTKCGINKIVLLTHIGLKEDIELAKEISGVDIIVGGHSHTRLGDFTNFDLEFLGDYPVIVKDKTGEDILIVHAWEWGKVLGSIDLTFTKDGVIERYEAYPKLIVHKSSIPFKTKPYRNWFLVDEDPLINQKLFFYKTRIDAIKSKNIAFAGEELNRGRNTGAGPIIADSMRWKAKTQIAILNPGAVRSGVTKGKINVASLHQILPYENLLVKLTLSGGELKNILENGIDFQIKKNGKYSEQPFVYVSGITFTINLGAPRGKRIQNIQLIRDNKKHHIRLENIYSVVVNDFILRGGDEFISSIDFKNKQNLNYVDTDVFKEYIQGKTLFNRKERIFVTR